MNSPPNEQVRAGEIARDAIKLGRGLCASMIDGKRVDQEIEVFVRDQGGEPALKGYQPPFAQKPYEWTTCISIDNEAVHAVPVKMMGPPHLITIDLVVRYQGWYADTARTFTTNGDAVKQQFAEASMAIFEAGLDAIAPMQSINFFGIMIEESAKLGEYGIIKEYCGHGIGKSIHMSPQVLNYNDGGRTRDIFEVGQSYAVEPVLAIDRQYQLEQHSNGWTVSAGCLTSHNEDTIFIGQHSVINLTGDDHE